MTYAIIMAGGIGTRFWPKSRESRPKQFLKFFDERTLFQNTVDRISKIISHDRILVITNEQYVDLVQQQIPDLPAENIIGEPIGKNTAPCIALAATIVKERDPEGTMIVLPSDHYITKPDKFLSVLQAAVAKANEGANLVTIGIEPHRPETGYGYIQFNTGSNEEFDGIKVHEVVTFAEKPDIETAVSFLKSGDFLWNSGMFVWKASTILDEIKIDLPHLHNLTNAFPDSTKKNGIHEALNNFYRNANDISIDYGVMEKAQTVYVVPGDFGWNDVGSWLAVYELEKKDKLGNVIKVPSSRLINSSNCYVSSSTNRFVAVVGLQGVAVVDTDDALLVARLDGAQDVKKVVESLNDKQTKPYR